MIKALKHKLHGPVLAAARAMHKKLSAFEQKHVPSVFVFEEFKSRLIHLDAELPRLDDRQIQRALEEIPLQVFGEIQIERPAYLPEFANWLPEMPSAKVQEFWTGSSGHVLLNQSIAFAHLIVGRYYELAAIPLAQAKVLDFGCGWGRLTRLLYKYVPAANIYGVDPWDESIRLCRECGVKGNLYISEDLPRTLPTPAGIKFNLIIAFSVFTHLSEKALLISIRTLCDHLADDGVIAITVMPREYWEYRKTLTPDEDLDVYLKDHAQKGIAFRPHGREKVEGEVTYGDTSMSIDFIKERFPGLRVAGVEWNKVDPYQIVVFLKKS